jgi:hypothetical protein
VIWFTIFFGISVGLGIYGEVAIIQNGTQATIDAGIALLAISTIFFHITMYKLCEMMVDSYEKNNKSKLDAAAASPSKPKNKIKLLLSEVRQIYPYRATILYILLLAGIAILPNSTSPNTQMGIALLAVMLPVFLLLFLMDWWLDATPDHK